MVGSKGWCLGMVESKGWVGRCGRGLEDGW